MARDELAKRCLDDEGYYLRHNAFGGDHCVRLLTSDYTVLSIMYIVMIYRKAANVMSSNYWRPNWPLPVFRQLSKCMVIKFEYHKDLGAVK